MSRDSLQTKLAERGDDSTCPAALIVRDGRLLVGMRHYTPDKFRLIDLWTTPGGRCDDGETLEITLRRETAEEVGISDLEIVAYVGEVPGAKSGDRVPCFLCRTDKEPTLMEPEKFSNWHWAPLDDVPQPFINDCALEILRGWLSDLR